MSSHRVQHTTKCEEQNNVCRSVFNTTIKNTLTAGHLHCQYSAMRNSITRQPTLLLVSYFPDFEKDSFQYRTKFFRATTRNFHESKHRKSQSLRALSEPDEGLTKRFQSNSIHSQIFHLVLELPKPNRQTKTSLHSKTIARYLADAPASLSQLQLHQLRPGARWKRAVPGSTVG